MTLRPLFASLLLLAAPLAASAQETAPSTQIYKDGNIEVSQLSDFEAGTRMYDAGNIDMAVKLFKQGAEKKDPQSSFALGTHYFFGEGVEKDFAKAKELFEFAGEHGSMESLFFLSLMYDKGDGVAADPAKSFDYALRASRGCVAPAQSWLAGLYIEGKGVAKDMVEAMAWMTIAADQDEEARSLLPAMSGTLDEAQAARVEGRVKALRAALACPAPAK